MDKMTNNLWRQYDPAAEDATLHGGVLSGELLPLISSGPSRNYKASHDCPKPIYGNTYG